MTANPNPYVPGFDIDIFISFASQDNRDGWVRRFVESLRSELQLRAGQDIRLFVDFEQAEKDNSISTVVRTTLQGCAIYVPLLSLAYLNSTFPRTELDYFQSGHVTKQPKPIVPIQIGHFQKNDLAVSPFRDLVVFAFLDRDQKGRLSPSSWLWQSLLQDLAGTLISTMDGIRAIARESEEASGERDFDPKSFSQMSSNTDVAEEETLEHRRGTVVTEETLDRDDDDDDDDDDDENLDEASDLENQKGESVSKKPIPTPPPPEPEAVSAHTDSPALIDELGRRPFAEVLAARINEVWKFQKSATVAETFTPHSVNSGPTTQLGFMIHVDGPWGSGKTSVLNLLRAALQPPTQSPETKWTVINFNAWQQQRIRPPWWSLIKEIYAQSCGQLKTNTRWLLVAQWTWWRIRADLLPLMSTVVVLLIGVLFTTGTLHFGSVLKANRPIGDSVDLGLKIVTAILAISASVYALSRTMIFGSSRAAQTYSDLRSDPLRPIVKLFGKLVRTSGCPFVVMIDDLDRCDGKYVVELLEGIQTLFRHGCVTYVVAADRRWICSSFEKEFQDHRDAIAYPGKPLGYLFLEKIFQVSVSIPRLSFALQQSYWKNLLDMTPDNNPKGLDAQRKQAEAAATKTVENISTQEGLERKIEEAANDPLSQQAIRAAAAKQITKPAAVSETEHRLQKWAPLIEQNPRTMKRVVNAVALQQAIYFLEGKRVSPETLAQWIIIQLHWPVLATFLTNHPEALPYFYGKRIPKGVSVPDEVSKLIGDPSVKKVIEASGIPGASKLDRKQLEEIIG